jgi:hypothetical protein
MSLLILLQGPEFRRPPGVAVDLKSDDNVGGADRSGSVFPSLSALTARVRRPEEVRMAAVLATMTGVRIIAGGGWDAEG